jgi:probable O-glycosylation ligase (exosortase A-associated)
MIGDNNDFGLALTMTLPIFFFLARSESAKWLRGLMWLLFTLTIPGIFFTYSRGALVGLLGVLFFMIMRSSQRAPLLLVMVVMASFAVLFTPEHWQERMDFRQDGALMDKSALGRINSWTYCWRLALDYPVTGAGFGAFTAPLFDRYAPDPLNVLGPHSIYFGVLAEQGFVGLLLYLMLAASCYRRLRRVQRYARESGDSQAENYSLMIQLSLVGFFISGAFLGRAYFDYYFTLVACVAVLTGLCMRESAGVQPVQPSYSDSAEAEAMA